MLSNILCVVAGQVLDMLLLWSLLAFFIPLFRTAQAALYRDLQPDLKAALRALRSVPGWSSSHNIDLDI